MRSSSSWGSGGSGGCGKAELLWMADGNALGEACEHQGWDWRNETSSWGSGGSEGCGKAELLWMADGNGRALGKRANTKVGEDALGEACEHQGWGGLAQ